MLSQTFLSTTCPVCLEPFTVPPSATRELSRSISTAQLAYVVSWAYTLVFAARYSCYV